MADVVSSLDATAPAPPQTISERGYWSGYVLKGLLYILLTLAAVVALIPFAWMISNSLMTLGETINRELLPATPQWGNYMEAWDRGRFGRYFMNSVIITVVTIIGMVITSVLAGYAFARINFWGRNIIFTLLLVTLMIPESVVLVPNFLIVRGVVLPLPNTLPEFPWIMFGGSWLNKLPALTAPFMANAFSIFLIRQFFAQIPMDLWDAARIDGAGHLRFLLQVCIPISKPVVLIVTLLTFISSWNAFLWPLVVTTRDTWRPLMVGLWNFVSEGGQETHLLMAASVITILPMLILYFMTQKSFTEGIATTGLKG